MESPKFRKSSIRNFRKSRASFANGNCVEVGEGKAVIGVRDTQESSHPYRVTLEVPAAAWASFTANVKSGAVLPA
jgi:hypothetical protein